MDLFNFYRIYHYHTKNAAGEIDPVPMWPVLTGACYHPEDDKVVFFRGYTHDPHPQPTQIFSTTGAKLGEDGAVETPYGIYIPFTDRWVQENPQFYTYYYFREDDDLSDLPWVAVYARMGAPSLPMDYIENYAPDKVKEEEDVAVTEAEVFRYCYRYLAPLGLEMSLRHYVLENYTWKVVLNQPRQTTLGEMIDWSIRTRKSDLPGPLVEYAPDRLKWVDGEDYWSNEDGMWVRAD